MHAGHNRMVALCFGQQFIEERRREKHVGHFGIRFRLEGQQRQRDQGAIGYNYQSSNTLGHEFIWFRKLAPEHNSFLSHSHDVNLLKGLTRRNQFSSP